MAKTLQERVLKTVTVTPPKNGAFAPMTAAPFLDLAPMFHSNEDILVVPAKHDGHDVIVTTLEAISEELDLPCDVVRCGGCGKLALADNVTPDCEGAVDLCPECFEELQESEGSEGE